MWTAAPILTGVVLAGAAAAETLTVPIVGAGGARIGEVAVEGVPTGVLLTLSIGRGGLAPGWHGIHLHAVAECSDAGAFHRSMGHINPAGRKHGLRNPDGPDNADLPNLHAAADGSAHAQMFNARVTLEGGPAALLDADGAALVIHADPDDHASQPIGGAGARVACAAIRR